MPIRYPTSILLLFWTLTTTLANYAPQIDTVRTGPTQDDRGPSSKIQATSSNQSALANPAHILDSTVYTGSVNARNFYGWPGGQSGVVDNISAQRINGYNTLRFILNRRQALSPERTELSSKTALRPMEKFTNDPAAIRWVGDAIYVPQDYVFDSNVNSQVLVYQFLPLDSSKVQRPSCNSLRIVNNRWMYRIEYDTVDNSNYLTSSTYKRIEWDLGPVSRGVFTKWTTHVKFSWTSSGYLKVYKNGQLVLDYSGPTAHNDPNGYIPIFKFGVYKPLWGEIADNVETPTNSVVLYHSDTKLGNSNATMSDVETLERLADPNDYVYMNIIADSMKVVNKLVVQNRIQLPGTTSQYIRGDGSLAPAGFEYLANKSNNLNLGTSATQFPTQLAVKTYIDTRSILKKGTIPETANLDTIRIAGIYYASDGPSNTPSLGYPVATTGMLIAYNSSPDDSGARYQEFVNLGGSRYYRFKSATSAWTAWNLVGKDTSLVHTFRDETIRDNKTFTGTTTLKNIINNGTTILNGVTTINASTNLTGSTNTFTGTTTTGNNSANPLSLFRTGANQLSLGFKNESVATYVGITSTGELRVGPSNNLAATGQPIWHAGNQIQGKSSFSGNGTQTEFIVSHGAAAVPKNVLVTPNSRNAAASFFVDSIDATSFRLVFLTAPPSGTNNIKINWCVYK